MNRIFRVIWSTALSTWVVASELATRQGKSGGADRPRNALDAEDRIRVDTHGPRALRLGVMVALLALYAPAHAQTTLYWDVNGTAVGTGGTGTWDLSTPYWNSASDGVTGPMVAWNNASINSAYFGGTAGTVTLGTPITANSLTFNTNGYTLSGSTLTLAGTTPTVTVNTGTATISSVIAGTAGLTKNGPSSLNLTGANTFSGGITVNAGTLVIGSDAALGNSANGITLANGTALWGNGSAFNASRVITVQSGQANILGAALSAQITGAGGVNISGTINNNSNTYTGKTSGQNFSFTSVANLGVASALGAPTDATLGTILSSAGGTLIYTGSGNQSNRAWELDSTATIGNTLSNSGSGTLTLTGNINAGGSNATQMLFNASTADMSLQGVISAVSGRQITFTGSGTGRTIALGGANTYNGPTSISSVTVQAGTLANTGNNSSFGTGTAGGISITNGVLSYTGGAASSNFPLTIAGASTISNDGSGALSLTGATGFAAGTNTLTLGGSYTGTNTLSGVVSGTGNVVMNGAGSWVLGGANTYTGTTTVQSGTLTAGSAQAFGASTGLVVNGGTLDLNSQAITAASLAGTGGTVNLGSGSLTLNGSSGSTSYAGTMTGSGGLSKLGASSLTLSGTNAYTGATTVGGGTLTLNFTAAGAPASNIISSASTLIMSGGTLAVNGNASASTSQSFNGLNVTAGSNKIVATAGSGSTLTLGLGSINQSGGVADFDYNSGATITTSNADGALGGWATVNGTDYAQVSGGVITALTSYANKDDASTWVNGDIVSDAGSAANTPYFNTVTGSVALGGLKYTAAANSTVTVGSGNTLGVDGNILVTSTVGTTSQTIQGGSLTGGASGGPLGVLQNSAGTYTIASTIVDNGAPTSFTVGGSGTGTVALTGANTYTGATTLSGGTLAFNSVANGGSASAIGAASSSPSNLVLQNGTLDYTGATASTDRGFTLQNGGPSRTIQVDGSANLTFSGLVTSPDSSGLNVTGTGTLTLANAANTFVGPININGGTLAATTLTNGGQASSIGAASNASANLVLQNGGTLAYTGSTASTDRGFTLGNSSGGSGQVSVSQAGTTLTDSGTVVGNGSLVKGGAGTLVLTGTNTYGGGTTVNAGTLRAGSSLAFGGAANGAGASVMVVNAGGTLDLAGNSLWVGGLYGAGNVTLGSGTLQINNNGTFSGNISGTGGVTVTSGTQAFSGCGNAYTGPTTISNSVLNVSCLSNGGVASDVGASSAAPSNLVLASGTLQYLGATATTDRGFTLTNAGSINVANAATTLTFGGQVTGSGALLKDGPGTLVLTGTTNNYGGTAIHQGILRAGATNALGVSTTSGLSFSNVAGAILDMNGFDTSVAALAGGGTAGGAIQLTNKTLTINDGVGGVTTFAGAISGSGNLVKNLGGTQALSGCGSTYTGTTTINAGILSVSCLANGGTASAIGAASNAAGNLVLNGGTLQYTGTGNSTDHLFTLGPSTTSALDASGTGAVQFTNTGAIAFSSANTAQTVTLTGSSTANNSLAAQITDNGTGQTSFSKTGTGTWILNNAASSYTGVTTIAGGVLGVSKLSNGGQASSIGASSNAASNLIIGSGSTLLYTGSGDTTDRLFTLSTGVSYINSSGTGAVVFSNTGSASYTGSGNRTLALGGTNTNFNTMGGTIIDGTGGTTTLAKNDAGTWVLTGNNSYTGNTVINNGNLMIGNGGTTGNAGAGNVIVFASTSTLSFNRSNTFNFTGTLSGPGTIAQIGTGTTVLTSASNSIGSTTVSAGTLQVNGGLTSGAVTVGAGTLQVQAGGTLTAPTIAMNTGSTLTVNGTVAAVGNTAVAFSGNTGPSTINVNSGGTLIGNGTLAAGGGNLVNLSGTLNTGSGALNLGTGNDTLVLNDGGIITGVVDGGTGGESGVGDTLQVNTATSRTLDGVSTTGFETLLKQGTGTLTLTSTQSYSAGTTVQAGTLLVDGNQTGTGGPVTVQSGATLGGTGTIAGNVTVANGGALNPGDTGSVGALTVNGNLTLNSGAALNYQFGQANTPGGSLNDLTTVNGNLTLGGTLNVSTTSGGSFGPGVYRVFNYAGTLTNNGLGIGTVPAGTYYVQTSVANQVNLVNSTGLTLNFWDGAAGPKDNGVINGGNGTWQNSTGNDNWADSTGEVNAPYTNGAFAVFQGTPGTVTVDNSLGSVSTSGMQFAVDGYTITGNALTLSGAPNIIRVGDGTAAGAGMTATINAALVGTGGVQKTDLGTLVLNGTNTYTGGTAINGGTVSVSSDANLGSASGGLTLDSGTLRNTAAFTSARAVTLNTNGGTFDTQANLTLSGTIGGTGALSKTSSGTLTLTGANTYSGATTVQAGTLLVDGNQSAATGLTTVQSGATLGGNGTLGGNLVVASGGALNPGDTGAVGALTVSGNLTLNSGAALNYQFGQANTPGGALNDLTTVNGNLTLAGTLNVSTSPGGSFGPGVYRIFNYAGTLTNNGLGIGTAPAGTYYVQTSIANQVNLVNSTGLTVNFWDGAAGPKDNGVINGGNGTWQNASGNDNWADSTGKVNAPYANGSFAVFEATPGTVTVDDSLGNVAASGLQFAVSGYTVTGDALTLTGASNILRVGDGTAASAGMTATIASVLTGTGSVQKTDLGTLVLTGSNTYSGGTTITAGTLQLGNGGSSGSITGDVVDNGALAFNRSDSATFGGVISGSGSVTQAGAGTTTLTGTNTYSGATTVQTGTLLVDGNQAGATGLTSVQSGATLGGNGTLGGNVTIANGGALNPGDTGAVGALTVNGNLLLNSGAALNYQFGQANTPGGALNDLTTVNGNLTLGGTLNITATSGGNFGPGVYRILNYGGTLTDNGLSIGSAPAGTYYVQTSVANQVNLVNSTGLTLNFWDGPGHPNDGTIQGGSGVWQNASGNDNWADQTGTVNAPYTDATFAVFGGTAGTVTVDNSLGAVHSSGMQFAVGGYTIAGNAITLAGAPNIIRVGDGTAAGASMTATINAALLGTGGVQKTDLGTLVLNGTNTYTGGTAIDGGVLQVSSDGNLGNATGGLTLDGGTLRNTAAFTSPRVVTLNTNGGTFDTQANLTLSGAIGGAGALTKLSSGLLTLTGSNTYAGGTSINGGTVSVASDANLGNASGPLAFNAGTLQNTASFTSARATALNTGGGTFQTTGNLTLTGAISGAGALTKTDVGTLLLGADNTYAGGTTIAAGTLQLGNGGMSGSITGNVADNGALIFDRSDTYSFAGVISGNGSITQQGTGVTVLSGNNSYAGSTTVNAGTLIVDGNQSMATALTSIANGGTLGGNGMIGGNVTIANGGALNPGDVGSVPGTLTINGSLALGNSSTLNYRYGQANVVGGAYNDLTKVGGNLTLGGTLNVTTTAGATFDPGIYRIISYSGTLTNNGLTVGSVPTSNFYVQTSINHEVNLVNTAGLQVNVWDGPGNPNDGIVQGGSGLWQNASGNTNWATIDGSVNGTYQNGGFAIFTATPGTVTVDNSLGAVLSSGMQFAVDGYTVQGGAITLIAAPNIIRVGDGSSDGASMTATIASALIGAGGVQKTDLGTLVLTGTNTYNRGTTITAGTLQLGNGGTSGSIAGDVVDNGVLAFNRSDIVPSGGVISGTGSVTQAGSGTTVLTGASTYSGGTTITAGTLQLGNGGTSGSITGDVVDNGALAFNRSDSATFGGVISGSGSVTQAGTGTTVLTGGNTYSGGTTITAGTLQLGNGGTSGSITGNVVNNGALAFNRSDSVTFSGVISGSGSVTQAGSGTTTLTGSNAYSGTTTVQAGTLLVDGNQSAATGLTTVQSGATLGGNGTLGGDVVVASGGALNPGDMGAVGALTVNGNLTLNSGAALNYQFGRANTPGGALNDLTTVNGNLTLGGALNVSTTSGGSFGPGVYRVFNYAGTLTNNGLSIGSAPTGTYYVQTSVANQVNLVNSTGLTLNFWDGAAGPKDNSVIDGGNGTWQNSTGNDNWADSTGQVNASYTDGAFAVFQGTPGTVTVDNSLGNVTTSGMQFATSGYTVAGDALTLAGAPNIIRVGDGTAAGANMTATINAALVGTGGVQKTDLGTLVLNGANTYAGGTAIDGGTISVSSDANLGDAAGALTLDGGTLRNTAAFTSTRAITLNTNGGTFDTQADLTLSGTIGGTGALSKTSSGTLTLTDTNTYSGATTVQAGTLLVDGNQSAATGLTTVQSGATLGGNGTLGGDVTVANGGTLSPGDTGAVGTLTVNGNLTLNSGATLNYQFGQANMPGGSLNDLTVVHGNLTLAGTLNASTSAGGSFGAGVYRVFNYDGSLTDNGLVLGTVPARTLYLQTSIAHQVNLVDSSGLTLNFWDGPGNESNSVVNGGTGTWRVADNDYWTDASGALNASYSNGAFAVFAGTPGTVTIDNTNGQVQASGLQFEVDGYHLAGGTLVLSGSTPTIRVGDGTTAGANMTATIDAVLAGAGTLVKDDLGTLVLTGNNTYAGGTTVQAGTLQVASDANLGDTAGALTLGDGTLHTTASFQTQRAVRLTGNGTFQTDGGTTLTLGNAVSGTGSLAKTGAGTLVLGAASTYSGATTVTAGTLQAAVANAFSASSAVTVATNGTLDLAGFAQNVASLTNAGTVHFGSTPGTTLTVQGDYVGQGGTLNFNTVLGGDSSSTDQLIVNGNTSGNSVVHVTNVGGTGAATTQGIKLIDVHGASNGTFSLAGNYVFQGQQAVVAGAYAYRLYQGGTSTPSDGDWYLRSALLDPPTTPGTPPVTTPLYQPGVPLYEAYAGVLRQINTLDSLYQRVSDRTWAGNASATDAMTPGDGLWMRVQGAGQTYKPEVTTSGADYDISTWKTEAGMDAKLGDTSSGTLVAGAALQAGRYQSNVVSVYGAGRIKTNTYGINATLTWYGNSGFYADGQWRWTRFNSDLYSTSAAQVLKNGNKGSGYAVGVEAGQRFRLGEAWSLTPQVQVNYGRAVFNAFNDAYGANVSVQQGRGLIGRAGLALDYRNAWQGSRGAIDSHLYAIANLYRDFEGATRVDVSGADLASRNERLWGGLGVGGSLDWGHGLYSIYGEVQGKTGLSHFGDSHDVTGTLGFRMRW
jgi:fibronectin-binding autotransporter adhesin